MVGRWNFLLGYFQVRTVSLLVLGRVDIEIDLGPNSSALTVPDLFGHPKVSWGLGKWDQNFSEIQVGEVFRVDPDRCVMLLGRFIGDFVEYIKPHFLGDFPPYILCWYTLYPCSTKIMMGGVPVTPMTWNCWWFFWGQSQAQATFMLMGKFIPGNEADLVPWQWRIWMCKSHRSSNRWNVANPQDEQRIEPLKKRSKHRKERSCPTN